MIRLLGTAIALLALVSVLHFAEATEPTPLRIGMTPAISGPYTEYGAGNGRTVELPIAAQGARRRINDRKNAFDPVVDDQIIPDRAVQKKCELLDDKSLVGSADSEPALAVVEMAAANGRTFMSQSHNRPQSPTQIVMHPPQPKAIARA